MCVCVCSSVRSPHPQHAFASCDYLIVSHYPPPPTPLAFPKHEALPGPPFQPRSRRDSLGLGPGPRPAAEELRTVHGHHRGPSSIHPPHTPSPLPQHPPFEKREGLWSQRPEKALDDGQDRKMKESPCWGGVGLRGEVGRKEEEAGRLLTLSRGGGVGGVLTTGLGLPLPGWRELGPRKWGPRRFSDLLEEDPSPARAQPPAHFSLSLLSQPRPCGAGCPVRGDWG